MAKLISNVYGEALFELAQEEGKTDDFMEEVCGLKQIFQEHEELNSLMNHPKIMKEEKIKVMEEIFKGRISDELVGFLALIITKDRYGEIRKILEYYIGKVKEVKGIGIAYVTTAVPLKEEQREQIVSRLLETAGYREMEMHYAEDSALIGGMVIRIGDRVVDSSIRTKLDELKKQLMKIQLA